jgi:hypothetical protein
MAYPRPTNTLEHYLGIFKQASKGTGGAPTIFLPYQGAVTLDGGLDGDPVREAGTGPYINRQMKTKQDPSGGFGMAWRPKTAAQIVAFFLGADAAAPGGSGHDHTSTPDGVNRTWLSMEQFTGPSGDIGERFVDSVLKSVTVSCEENKDLMLKAEWFGLTPGWQTTAASATYETGVSGTTPGGPFRAMEATYTVDGSAASNVKSFELALEWKFDEDIRLSRVTRGDALKLELTGTLKIVQLLDSTTARDDFRKINYKTTSGTVADKNFFDSGAFVAAFDNGLAAANQRLVTFTVPSVTWKKAKYSDNNPDGETMYLEKEGVVQKASGSAFVTVVSRTQDAAAY